MRFVWWRDAFRESRGVRCVEGVVLLEVCVSYGSGAVCPFVQPAVARRCREVARLIGQIRCDSLLAFAVVALGSEAVVGKWA